MEAVLCPLLGLGAGKHCQVAAAIILENIRVPKLWVTPAVR